MVRIYWELNYLRADGNRYNLLMLETKHTECILMEIRCK